MSSYNPLVRRAVASLLPMVFAGQAYSACTVTQGTLTNISAGVNAFCTGANTGLAIGSTNDGVTVHVASGSLTSSSVDLAGIDSTFIAYSGIDLTNTTVAVRGDNGLISLQDGSNLQMAAGSLVLGTVGAASSGVFTINGNLTAAPNVNTSQFLLTGLDGNQFFEIARNLTSSTGLFISAGNGNDQIRIYDSAVLGGSASPGLIDGGAGFDSLSFSLSGQGANSNSLNVNTTGIERLNVGTNLTLSGAHAFDDVRVLNGTLNVSNLATLGNASGQITLNSGATLSIDLANNAPSTVLAQSLQGNGTLQLTGINRVSLTGDSASFSGTLHVAPSSSGVAISDGTQVGTASILLEGQTRLTGGADYQLLNRISGDGALYMDGTGTVRLGTSNDGYTGTLTVNSGTLIAAGSWSTGSGEVSVETDGTLVLDAGSQDVDLVNDLYGDGTLIKRGFGTITLAGSNSFDGTTSIETGALRVRMLDDLGSAPVDVGVDGALILDYNDTSPQVETTLMTGQGVFIKEGTGLVVVDAANTYTGGTVIRAGRLGLNNGDGLGAGDIEVQTGGILGIGGVALANDVSGTGQIIKTASNQATLTGNNSQFTGELRVSGGSVTVQDVSALGTGIVNLDAGTELRINNATFNQMSTALYGDGDIRKSGAGTLTILNGTNPFLGDIYIDQGTLRIDGSGSSGYGNINMAAGTTLNLQRANGSNLANTLSGAGQVVKTGTGFMSIDQGGQYTGGTNIQEGGLRVTDLAALGTGPVTSSGGATLVLTHNGTSPMVINSIMQGSGIFQKEGTGLVVANAANSYTGGTVIQAGRLGLNRGDALGTGSIQVNSGAILGIGDITLGNNITGTGQIIKTASSVAQLTGNNNGFTGELAIQQGTVAVNSLAALGAGSVNISSGAALQFENTGGVTFANSISGTGSLTKRGAGRLDFTNPFTVGALNVDEGVVRMNATGTTNTTVAATAGLDGIGRIVGNLTNHGVVAPGNSIGTLTVEGNYVQDAGSVLEVEFDTAGNIDLLNVTGTATLSGGTLRFIGLGGAEGTGGTFLAAGGGITGTFSNVETVGAQLPLAVIYQASNAVMAPSVVSARPSTFNAQLLAGAETALGYLDQVSGAHQWAGADHVWFQGFGARGERDAADASLGFEHDSHGFGAGVIWPLTANLQLGASAGWARGDIALETSAGSGKQDSLLGALHLQYARASWQLGAGLLIGKLDQSTTRNVAFSGLTSVLDGETNSSLFGGYLQLQTALGTAGAWQFDASGRASLVRQSQDAYTEEGNSPLRLSVAKLNATTLEMQGLLTASRRIGGERGVDLGFDLGVRHLALQGAREIDVTFSSNAAVTLQGDQRDNTQAIAGVHATYALTPRLRLNAAYTGKLGSRDRHEAQLGASLAF